MKALSLHILFPRGERERLETHPSAMEELAQDLVVMQTHRLNTDDQSFKTDDKDIAKNDREPESEARLLTCQSKDRETQASMRHGKRADTDKGKCVAEQADD